MDCMVQSPLGNWYSCQDYRECEAIPSNLHWEILTGLLKPAEYCVLKVKIGSVDNTLNIKVYHSEVL